MPMSSCAASTANESSLTCCDCEMVMTALSVEVLAGAAGTGAAAPATLGAARITGDGDAIRVCHPQPRRTTSWRCWISTCSKYRPGRMQTSPPVLGSAWIAALIEVYWPTLSTPSPTVFVQQQPHSPSDVEGGHFVRQSVAEFG